MLEAINHIHENLDLLSKRISSPEDVRSIAMVSSNNDESIADVIVSIYSKIGLKGAISIQDGPGYSR